MTYDIHAIDPEGNHVALIHENVSAEMAQVYTGDDIDALDIEGTVEEWGRCDLVSYTILPHGEAWTKWNPDEHAY